MPLQPKKPAPFNPLEKRHLAEAVANALLSQEVSPLPPPEPFIGAGVYAIYYHGDFAPYNAIVKAGHPIYVGEAIAEGSRKGGFGLDIDPGPVLYLRLRQHARSIEQATNLTLADFGCRYLVTEDIWVPLAENMLIETFQPLWNKIVDGFGNHDPGKGRYNQQRSSWDTVHSGRPWAEKCVPCAKSQADILNAVTQHITALGIG
jgi:hypothetical protein